MRLEDQCVSLELAKRLKELGFKQESLFYWVTFDNHAVVDTPSTYKTMRFDMLVDEDKLEEMRDINHLTIIDEFSAYTVAELGEMLPQVIKNKEGEFLGFLGFKFDESTPMFPKKWKVIYEDMVIDKENIGVNGDTEADARAKMLIYLKESKLI